MMNPCVSVFEPIKTSIAPWLSVSQATEAMDYYQAAFSAVERYRLEDDEGLADPFGHYWEICKPLR
jgi:uncharacterized glyoxalase superfamily protein PhnB